MTTNQFIGIEGRAEKFHKMAERISEITGIDLKFISKAGDNVLNEWEKRNNRKLTTLFKANEREKHDEIHKMAEKIEKSIAEKISSPLLLKKVETIAEFWLDELYFQI